VENEAVEVSSLIIEEGGEFTVTLSAGEYQVVASTETGNLSEDVEVVAGEERDVEFDFAVALTN
jgi:hypothetical protein